MSSLNSKGFKITLTSLATVVGLLITVSPYLNLASKVQAIESENRAIKVKYEIDHDLLIQISADIRYVKEEMKSKKNGN